LEHLKASVIAGFVMTCLGDERGWSFVPSRKGGTLADRVALLALRYQEISFQPYTFFDRGSDERQYCAPGVDLPFVSIMRSKYGEFPEYHTSLDDLSFVTPRGLSQSFSVMRATVELLEQNVFYRSLTLGEPQLGKRGLYPAMTTKENHATVRDMLNILAYADGELDMIALSEKTSVSPKMISKIAAKLMAAGIMEAR
jgi:aminopeptidase-like protein